MNFKKLHWEYSHFMEAHCSSIFYMWECTDVIIFFDEEEGMWKLHYDNRHPSEHIKTAKTLEELMAYAQECHEENIKDEFFKEE